MLLKPVPRHMELSFHPPWLEQSVQHSGHPQRQRLRHSRLQRRPARLTIHGSKAVGEPPLMLAISVREAIRDAVSCFETEGNFILPSPRTGEAVKMLITKKAPKEGRSPNRPSP